MRGHTFATTLICLAVAAGADAAGGKAPQTRTAPQESVERALFRSDDSQRCQPTEANINGWCVAALAGTLVVLQLRRKQAALQRSVLDL